MNYYVEGYGFVEKWFVENLLAKAYQFRSAGMTVWRDGSPLDPFISSLEQKLRQAGVYQNWLDGRVIKPPADPLPVEPAGPCKLSPCDCERCQPTGGGLSPFAGGYTESAARRPWVFPWWLLLLAGFIGFGVAWERGRR